ncbi:DUF2127 domain-containing protein [Pseudolysinimonas sp.]|uniref:DUF2127 domain-containing protein n=1 Tax=Pseudolysinimonas sp. TaxID=2680009 RepID=UPI003F7D79AE
MRRHVLDLVFLIGIAFKALDGLVEVVVGLPLLFLSPATLTALVRGATAGELLEDPHDRVARLLQSGVAQLHGHGAFFLGVYLLVHGVVKLAIVVALVVGATRVYPWAIAALSALTIYQIVEFALHPSVGIALLTLLDIAIIALTVREWREGRSLRDTLRATGAWTRSARADRAAADRSPS